MTLRKSKNFGTKSATVSVDINLQMKSSRFGMTWRPLAAFVAVLMLVDSVARANGLLNMDVEFSWGTPTFVFRNEQQRREMLANGTYIPGNSVPFDVDIGGPNRSIFVSLPWMINGSPATLATIQDPQQRNSPQLVPYPDWSWHAGARGCDGLTSVFRIHVDRCDRLWVVDSGIADAANTFRRQCPGQLLAFNLTTHELLVRQRFERPRGTCFESFMVNVAVEQMGDSCSNDAYAYAADAFTYSLNVYSLRSNSSWSVPSDLFFPDVNARRFRVAGTSFVLMDGVLGLALSPTLKGDAEDRQLFFHAGASFQEAVVRTSILRNQSLFAGGLNTAPEEFRFIGRRRCQAAGEAMTSNGVLFFSPVCENSIMCWNFRNEYRRNQQSEVERDNRLLRYLTSLKVLPSADGRGEDLWGVANNVQLLVAGQFQANVTDAFNIVRGAVDALVRRTKC